ncbi:hypothetical protein niasHS_003327 [Heterodera schachtii]|uniref:HMG box domain-containing protein n=3 Tax=Heterodera TaxID=34509 RepID=A0ABD2KGQ2_HETSC
MPKASKNKDPNMPKRAQSAYFIWMLANREKIKKPGMSVAEVAKAAGVEWGRMSAADKTLWEQKAADDKKRYEQEMTQYRARQK